MKTEITLGNVEFHAVRVRCWAWLPLGE